MTNKEIVTGFFIEGYVNKNYDLLRNYLSKDYKDHSPAGACSNEEAIAVLKGAAKVFNILSVEIKDIFAENDKVAVRVLYKAVHIGECMGIPASGKEISFEALEIFKVEQAKIKESWGYWPDKEIEDMLRSE